MAARSTLPRWLRHLFAETAARRHFPPRALEAIRAAIAEGETRHVGQVCFAIEGGLPLALLWRRTPSRLRAQHAFAHLRVWDTRENCGVLIFVLLADHAIEIVADRGIAARVREDEWRSICDRMRERFSAGEYERGAIDGVAAANAILAREFPADGRARDNELPDAPVIL